MKEIKIDVKKLLKAPIDDKNIMGDWLADSLFDDQEYTFSRNEYLGFVGNCPTFMSISGNMAEIYFMRILKYSDEISEWRGCILERLAEVEKESEKVRSWCFDAIPRIQYISDPICDNDVLPILTFDSSDEKVILQFHWNVPKN